jgi:protein involved in polysaccharide export with SLBB domain
VNAPDTLKSNPAEAAEKGAVVARAQKPHCILSRWTHVRKELRLVVFLVLACPSAVLAEDVDHDAYRLSPGDRITVTVFGQPELSGDILIDGAGTITIPLTDRIDVNALTLLECEKRIAERLADGILRKPAVSVRVAELRPLYVLGDVRQPGAYPFRYGSTVLSAVSLAGGFGPGELLRNTAVSEYLAAEQHVRELSLQKSTLLVRKARLQAQRDGNASRIRLLQPTTRRRPRLLPTNTTFSPHKQPSFEVRSTCCVHKSRICRSKSRPTMNRVSRERSSLT